MRKLVITTIAVATVSLGLAPVYAEVIKLPVGSQAVNKQQVERPENGANRAQVRAQYGEPLNSSSPVGNPPISSWEYTDYFVFFEYDTVLHTVLKHVPVAGFETGSE